MDVQNHVNQIVTTIDLGGLSFKDFFLVNTFCEIQSNDKYPMVGTI